MGDEEPLGFAVRGVVRNGQVVLDTPLGVPDGVYVTITPYRNGDVPELLDWQPLSEGQKQWFRADLEYLKALAAGRAAEGGGRDAA